MIISCREKPVHHPRGPRYVLTLPYNLCFSSFFLTAISSSTNKILSKD